jgi:hypothetical protein
LGVLSLGLKLSLTRRQSGRGACGIRQELHNVSLAASLFTGAGSRLIKASAFASNYTDLRILILSHEPARMKRSDIILFTESFISAVNLFCDNERSQRNYVA